MATHNTKILIIFQTWAFYAQNYSLNVTRCPSDATASRSSRPNFRHRNPTHGPLAEAKRGQLSKKEKNSRPIFCTIVFFAYICTTLLEKYFKSCSVRKDGWVAETTSLLNWRTRLGYRGFESPSFRKRLLWARRCRAIDTFCFWMLRCNLDLLDLLVKIVHKNEKEIGFPISFHFVGIPGFERHLTKRGCLASETNKKLYIPATATL